MYVLCKKDSKIFILPANVFQGLDTITCDVQIDLEKCYDYNDTSNFVKILFKSAHLSKVKNIANSLSSKYTLINHPLFKIDELESKITQLSKSYNELKINVDEIRNILNKQSCNLEELKKTVDLLSKDLVLDGQAEVDITYQIEDKNYLIGTEKILVPGPEISKPLRNLDLIELFTQSIRATLSKEELQSYYDKQKEVFEQSKSKMEQIAKFCIKVFNNKIVTDNKPINFKQIIKQDNLEKTLHILRDKYNQMKGNSRKAIAKKRKLSENELTKETSEVNSAQDVFNGLINQSEINLASDHPYTNLDNCIFADYQDNEDRDDSNDLNGFDLNKV